MALSMPDMGNIKKVNWRKVASFANPQSVKDLDHFLDKLPQRAGMNGIIVASIIWAIAGVSVLMAYTKSIDVQEVRKELAEAEALRPTVPAVKMTKVPAAAVKLHVDKVKELYKNIELQQAGDIIKVTSVSTRNFAEWRAAISDIAFGEVSWRLSVQEMCAGRECKGPSLQASVTVQRLDILYPEAK